MILLAGVGTVAVIRFLKSRVAQAAVGVVLLAGVAQLGQQAGRASYSYATDRRNPYVYAQTVPNALELVDWVKAIARLSPEGNQTVLKVVAPESDYWPLPWYLRQFKRVGWYDRLPEDPYAPMMIVSARLQAELDEKSNKRWLMVRLAEFRPGIFFELYVEFELWKKYVDTLPRPRDE
jgi:predicted membrane-bound mannosyltransferase